MTFSEIKLRRDVICWDVVDLWGGSFWGIGIDHVVLGFLGRECKVCG